MLTPADTSRRAVPHRVRGLRDLMLSKNFLVRERWRAQIRWEAFDAANTPYFQVPNEVVGNGSFGVINSTSANSRRIMQFGAKLYW